MLQKYKTPIIAIVVIVILFVVYAVFFKKDKEPVLTTQTNSSQGTSAENNELISLLSQLKSITLSKEIFTNSVFLSLFDFSVILVKEPISRPNPFAPIGSEGIVPTVLNEDQVDLQAGL